MLLVEEFDQLQVSSHDCWQEQSAIFDDPSAHDSDFGSEIPVAEQEFDETAAIAEVSSEEVDLGFGEISCKTSLFTAEYLKVNQGTVNQVTI